MVINDLGIECIAGSPAETDAPLIVDPNAVLPGPRSFESLQTVRRGHSEVIERPGAVKHAKLAQRDRLNVSG